jgi:hypothetical protein
MVDSEQRVLASFNALSLSYHKRAAPYGAKTSDRSNINEAGTFRVTLSSNSFQAFNVFFPSHSKEKNSLAIPGTFSFSYSHVLVLVSRCNAS